MVERDYRLFPNTQVFFMQIFSSDDGKWALLTIIARRF